MEEVIGVWSGVLIIIMIFFYFKWILEFIILWWCFGDIVCLCFIDFLYLMRVVNDSGKIGG